MTEPLEHRTSTSIVLEQAEHFYARATLTRWIGALQHFRLHVPDPWSRYGGESFDLVARVELAHGQRFSQLVDALALGLDVVVTGNDASGRLPRGYFHARFADGIVELSLGGTDEVRLADETTVAFAQDIEARLVALGYEFQSLETEQKCITFSSCPALVPTAPVELRRTPHGWTVHFEIVDDFVAAEGYYAAALDAARKGDVASVRKLVRIGVDPALASPDGETLLHVARTAPMTRLLLGFELDPRARDRAGRTPLHRTTDLESIELLVGAGAEVCVVDAEGRTVLMQPNLSAAANRYLMASVPVDAVDTKRGWSALFHQCLYGGEPYGQRDMAGIEALLAAGARPNLRDLTDRTIAERAHEWVRDMGDAAEAHDLRALLARYGDVVAEPAADL